ncbi:2-dehydropantoate 2-reductase [Cytobacillus purgationiresistens]|uniref:2-dehydropantoate 2-reductase n=1 Tax=Cytobacillus purgationiresistens TaxID=863449 RepID=A0ABU0ARK0_9BACI|nr:2-dehydropantoate 2-reductase [Cytobacillus purgationiresistens]MDQ0273901.1 2-dehydropantoate 2-reductase [Cytobacillus purgationiresistens]
MKISIIGGGSIGLLFAHYLNKYHHVTLYVRSEQQARLLSSSGLIMQSDQTEDHQTIQADVIHNWTDENDLTILAVKQYHLSDLMEKLGSQTGSPLLFLQNGMGHLSILQELKQKEILLGVVEHGALKVNGNTVIHSGFGKTKLAKYKGSNELVHELLSSPIVNFSFTLENNYLFMLQEKLVVNAVINPITAILKIRNGELVENKDFYIVFQQMFHEVVKVLNIKDIDHTFSYLESVCRQTAANRSSMVKDIEEGRPTEIDAILGYLLDEARRKKIHTPLTASLFHLIKGLEEKEGN